MSKYRKRGAYHYEEFADEKSVYRAHVLNVIQLVKDYVRPESRILDVGCGEGLIAQKVRELGHSVIGVDVDHEAIRIGQHFGNDVTVGTIEDFALERFDAILMLDVLEHVENLGVTLQCAIQMAPLLIVAVPDRLDPHAVRQHCFDEIVQILIKAGYEFVTSGIEHAREFGLFRRPVEVEVEAQ